ncbi:hypothetical protein AMTR_s00001p00260080 [Amborella trichopoda]|uniref:DNA topoisomerase (ATP-hydrolyzing) n=1 Tax=Amborella trichopoda TaxID=13333 RepID=W1NKX6_AMBTC|nr:hypothetical protein AMTR_s00001p00260080 [Amborella trichopoda]
MITKFLVFQVRARIEATILKFLHLLASPTPTVADLPLIARRSKNARFRHSLFGDVTSIYLSQSLCRISLMKINVAKTFIRVWKVLELCFQLLVHGKQVTQRELFYKLLSSSPKYFDSQVQVNKSVQDVVSLLCCSRNSLGLMPSSRGTVVGRLLIQEENQEIVDCSLLGPAGQAITGNLHLLENFVFQSNARYIFVIEKDAIFQRLAEDRIFNHIPSILVTAKGYPDIATRVFLHRLSKIFPTLPILALVDWNPAGLAILCTYKFGSIGMGLEAYRYACDVKWLGLRSDDLMLVPQDSKVMMKTRDLQIAKSLMSSDMLQDHKYKEELRAMIQGGQRVEIEALYAHGYEFLGRYMVTKVVQDDYF